MNRLNHTFPVVILFFFSFAFFISGIPEHTNKLSYAVAEIPGTGKIPGVPTIGTATATSSTTTLVRWTRNQPLNEICFWIYSSDDGGNTWVPLAGIAYAGADSGVVYNLTPNMTYIFKVLARNDNGYSNFSKNSNPVKTFPTTSVAEGIIQKTFSLQQNYPNPFNPSTTIKYSIPKQSYVTLKVYDILGREVAALVNEKKPAGVYEINWNASKLSSGVYFYQLKAGEFIQTKKMILIK